MSVSENVMRIRENIERAAARSGGNGSDVILVAACKSNVKEKIREAISAGVDACGENRVQELIEKNAAGVYAGCPLHFIGHLQKNKVRQIVGVASLIQSADSAELIEMISKRALHLGICQDVLIEVNIGREAAKSGVDPRAAAELAAFAGTVEGVCVRGLMAIPPYSPGQTSELRCFQEMYNIFVDIKSKKYNNIRMDYLSMGMSADYEAAVSCGANMVRIGSAVFGARQ